MGNTVQLEQLVSTLVDNAISHARYSLSTERPCIRVRLFSERGHAVLEVANPGDPIAVEEREKIFERFYRSDRSRQLNGHYGLGLAIAKGSSGGPAVRNFALYVREYVKNAAVEEGKE